MGGIAAYLGLDSVAGTALLRRLGTAQAHRGQSRSRAQGDRLGVLGLAGTAALASPGTDSRYLVVLDGALTNADDLRAELTQAGELPGRPDAVRDSDLVLAAWRTWGDAGLARCAGCYAIVIADLTDGSLTLVRDELGGKPLYLAELPPSGSNNAGADESSTDPDDAAGPVAIVVASEIPALLRAGRLVPAPDDGAVYDFLRHGAQAHEARTCYAGVSRVRPGELVTVAADGTVTRRRYGHLRADLHRLDRRTHRADPAARALVAAELQRAVRDGLATGDDVGVPRPLAALAPGRPVVPDPEPLDPTALADELVAATGVLVEPLSGPATWGEYRTVRAAAPVAVLLSLTGARALTAAAAGLRARVLDLWRRRRFRRIPGELASHPVGALRWLGAALAGRVRRVAGDTAEPVLGLLDQQLVRRHGAGAPVADPPPRERVLDALASAAEFADRAAASAGVAVRPVLFDSELLRTLWALDLTPTALPPLAGATPELTMRDWIERLDGLLDEVFTSPTFATRGYFDQVAVLTAYRAYRAGAAVGDPAVFWRLASIELWLRGCVDPGTGGLRAPAGQRRAARREPVQPGGQPAGAGPGWHPPAPAKSDYLPNPGRELISADGAWARYPLRVELIDAGADLPALAVERCAGFFAALPAADQDRVDEQRWYLFVSATAVAVAQGRTVLTWEVHPGEVARLASRLGTLAGPVGTRALGAPAAAQLLMDELGAVRVFAAGAAGVAGRVCRRPDWFTRVAGPGSTAAGGPRPDAAYPANVSAQLPPRHPDELAAELSAALRLRLPAPLVSRFGGSVVLTAADDRQAVLGHDTRCTHAQLLAAVAGNPLGQGREQTPLGVMIDLTPAVPWSALDVDTPPAPNWWAAPSAPAGATATARTAGAQTGAAQAGAAQPGAARAGAAQAGAAQVGGAQVGGAQVEGAQVGGAQVGGAPVGGAQVGGAQVGGAQTVAVPPPGAAPVGPAPVAVPPDAQPSAAPAVSPWSKDASPWDVETPVEPMAPVEPVELVEAVEPEPEPAEIGFGGFRWEYDHQPMVRPPWRRRDRGRVSR